VTFHPLYVKTQQSSELYGVYRPYINHFLPVTKLQKKVREASCVKKIYDAPRRPISESLTQLK
jgi:hypothetical protein